ncbi:probable cysteine desulfurase isoform X1 [Octopus vulgaris]|uniref:Probable cysteine desulfurase isoform X1 n=1 Tax=Octopus vulgaris TaxID=6645 RepID=A0AA36C0Q3_OCTVU|nr:probable cysteine desulfurase isoform X1 [Octopus vulgaris]
MGSTMGSMDVTMDGDENPVLKTLRENVIGSDLIVNGPYGPVKVIYCDFTASGRSMKFIEDYINEYVRPFYGNTHTTTSIVSRQTTKFRDEARQIIKNCVNATDDDVVIFCGAGCTGAIHKLIGGLDIQEEQKEKTVVLIGPYEHHSNILPWQELGLEIRRIREDTRGCIDKDNLEELLKSFSERNYQIITAFSAASNVTGIITDTVAIARMVHKYKAYSFWDFASAGPYLKIDMNPAPDATKDAVFLSPHKFLGGPGTPGLLIAKKKMFRNPVPTNVGGGTVLYVTRDSHLYVKDIESREEGGTPAIIESIRAGLIFKLKEEIGMDLIAKRDEELCARAFQTFKHRQLMLLGRTEPRRLPIFSFIVRVPAKGKFLHHNFVSVLLNDLFGIQARGGCACAGPYAQMLLGISESLANVFTRFINNKENCSTWTPLEVMKPGFTRLNLPFFYDDATIDYILKALKMVADFGWQLLPLYVCDPKTGAYTHKKFEKHYGSTSFSLHDIKLKGDKFMNTNPRLSSLKGDYQLDDILHEAYHFIQDAQRELKQQSYEPEEDSIDKLIPENLRKLRWFLTSSEALEQLKKLRGFRRLDSTSGTAKCSSPFVPRQSTRRMTMDPKYREEMKAFLSLSTTCSMDCCSFGVGSGGGGSDDDTDSCGGGGHFRGGSVSSADSGHHHHHQAVQCSHGNGDHNDGEELGGKGNAACNHDNNNKCNDDCGSGNCNISADNEQRCCHGNGNHDSNRYNAGGGGGCGGNGCFGVEARHDDGPNERVRADDGNAQKRVGARHDANHPCGHHHATSSNQGSPDRNAAIHNTAAGSIEPSDATDGDRCNGSDSSLQPDSTRRQVSRQNATSPSRNRQHRRLGPVGDVDSIRIMTESTNGVNTPHSHTQKKLQVTDID